MSMLKDADMSSVVDEFCRESDQLLDELEDILDEYEDTEDSALLEKYGQTIDRIMGAAQSLDAHYMGTFAQLGKTIGYKASQVSDPQLLNIVSSVLFDLIEVMKKVNQQIKTNREEKLIELNIDALKTRFLWLADKLKDIKRSSVAIDDEALTSEDSNQDVNLINDLVNELK